MITGLSTSDERFLNDFARIQDRMTTAQRQLSSGLRVSDPSDDPGEISAILQLISDLSHNEQVKTNLERIKTDVDTAEGAVRSAVDLLDSALSLATQAGSPAQTPATMAALAQQVAVIQERMVAVTATQVDGRYVFGGDEDQVAPYTLDPTQPNGVLAASVAPTASNQAEEPAGGRFQTGRTAAEIFDSSTTGNVFAALESLRLALVAGDADAATQSVAAVKEASEFVNNQLSFYGAVQNRVSSALDSAAATDTRLRTELSARRDADMTEAIIEFSQSQVQMEAALQVRAQSNHPTLFDLLG